MRILLTGSSGMVGKNILEHKSVDKHEFLTPNRNELNLLNYDDVYSYVKIKKPDLVIHSAGYVGGIQSNMKYPYDFLYENLEIGKNIIKSSKNNNVSKLINLGSSCIYPKSADNPLNEELILKGELEPTNEGYALAKIICLKLCEYISSEKKFQYKTIIPCNLYGRHDKFDLDKSHMVPSVIDKVHKAKINKNSHVEIWGDGQARREFMYAGDLSDFIFYSIDNFDKMPQNINVGIGLDFSILDYYTTISKIIGFDGEFKFDLSKPVGMRRKLVALEKLKKFGWKSKTSLEQGIKETYKYYKTLNKNGI